MLTFSHTLLLGVMTEWLGFTRPSQHVPRVTLTEEAR
jgi:hypothetical protein